MSFIKRNHEQTIQVRLSYFGIFIQNKPAAQAQALPDATPPIGKIYPFTKIVVTFESVMQFWCPSGFRKIFITITYSILYLEELSLIV